MPVTRKPGTGFGALSPEQRRARASLGGKAAHAKGTAHRWSSEEARTAGRKGGTSRVRRKDHVEASIDPTRAADAPFGIPSE